MEKIPVALEAKIQALEKNDERMEMNLAIIPVLALQ
jgi:hypothetical protein